MTKNSHTPDRRSDSPMDLEDDTRGELSQEGYLWTEREKTPKDVDDPETDPTVGVPGQPDVTKRDASDTSYGGDRSSDSE